MFDANGSGVVLNEYKRIGAREIPGAGDTEVTSDVFALPDTDIPNECDCPTGTTDYPSKGWLFDDTVAVVEFEWI